MSTAVLIIGAGAAGLQVAVDVARAGARAIVVERGPIVGGSFAAAMTAESSAQGELDGTRIPTFRDLAGEPGIEVLTLSRLEALEGDAGDFVAKIRENARWVTEACTRCNRCKTVCPVVASNPYDAGLSFRKAIYTPLGESIPSEYVIDLDGCLNQPPNYLPCHRCVEVCDDDAIHFDMPLSRLHERRIDAVVVAAGSAFEPGESLSDLGYGSHPDVVTSRELQRLLESPGPTGGYVARPSNEASPESILFVVDVASAFSAYVASRQLRAVADQGIEEISLLVLEQRRPRAALGELERAAAEAGAELHFGAMLGAEPTESETLAVQYVDLGTGRTLDREYEMVVLFPDPTPPEGLAELAASLQIDLDDNGYVAALATGADRVATSRPGIYVVGGASGPRPVADCITEARAAARLVGPPSPGADTTREETEPSPGELRDRIEGVLRALMERGESGTD